MNTVQATGGITTAALGTPCGVAGPEMRMLVLMVQNQLAQSEVAQTDVLLSQDQLKELREQVREAIQQAREAEEDSGFFGAIGDVLGGDIATLAEVVLVAAAAVATGGAAALVLASIAVACTLASKYGEELGIPPNVAMGLGIAAAVATVASGNVGGAASAVGGGAASGSAASSAGAAAGSVMPGVACGSAVASGGLASSAGAAARITQLGELAKDVQLYASIVAPAASGAGAGAHMVGAHYHAQALEHDADATFAQSRQTLASMSIDSALEIFEKSIDRQLAATAQTTQLLQANQRSKQLIIQQFERVA